MTASFIGSYTTCREQTRLHFVEGWGSRHVPIYFEFGTCCHWVLEQMYGPGGRKVFSRTLPDHRTLTGIIRNLVLRYDEIWKKENDSPTQKQLDQQELVYGMAEAVLPDYFLRWSGDFSGKYTYRAGVTAPVEWVSLEQQFDIPYVYPDGKTIRLRGRRDGVFRDRRGKLWVFDTKCRSMINDEDARDIMPFDHQQMLYLHVTYEEIRLKQSREKIAGNMMNIIRRPGHRQGKHETLQDFLLRIRNDYQDPKNYDDHYRRYEMAISREEVAEWKVNYLDPVLTEIRGWWEGTTPHYMDEQTATTKYGRCQMYGPMIKNDFMLCYRRDRAFSELSDV